MERHNLNLRQHLARLGRKSPLLNPVRTRKSLIWP
ncbi:hypothetical protein [Escherichia coli]